MTFRVDAKTSARPTDGTQPDAEGWYEGARDNVEAESLEAAQEELSLEVSLLKMVGKLPVDLETRLVPLS